MHDLTFHEPTTLTEAFALLDEHGYDARAVSGGTALILLMKQALAQPAHLVSLDRIEELRGIRVDDAGLHLGALTRHRQVETSSEVRAFAPLLAETYRRVATVRIRNMATVGGGLAHADPAQDPPAALIALDARVVVASARDTRLVPVEELFVDYYETVLEPDELITEVVVPNQGPGMRGHYLKFLPRTQDDYATVATAAAGRLEDGSLRDVRVALVAAGPTPVRARAVERELEGRAADASTLRRAAEAVIEEVDPLDDFRGSAGYKRDMAAVITRRALAAAFDMSET